MIQRHPRSTLFPYTTLCRSQSTWIRNFNPFSGDFRFPTINGIYEPLMIYNTVKGELVPWLATDYEWSSDNKKLTFTLRDRKSTRLNSSHANISYAVFCLKKK